MKKQLYTLLLLLLASVATMAQTKDERAVTAAVEQLRKAMVEANESQLRTRAADGLSYGHSSGKIEDKNMFVESITSGKSDFVTLELTNQTVKVEENTAIVRHQLDAQTNDSGKPGTVKLGVLLVWQKQNNNWRLLARQAYKL